MGRPPEEVRETVLDRVISWASPERGLKRSRARAAAAAVRHYEAASYGRRTQNWQRNSLDANGTTRRAGARLRDLARDLRRNNGWARRGIEVIANNTVGWGITPSAVDKSKGRAKRAQDAWNAWADSTACDADGRLTFYGLQRLVLETVVEAGEALVVRRWTPGANALGMQLQVLEPDYLDQYRDQIVLRDKDSGRVTGQIIQGVEFDAAGKRVAYWLFKEHPGAMRQVRGYTSERVSADDVLHVFRTERAGQVRGVSWLAAGIVTLETLSEYEDAELMRQKLAACFAVFVSDDLGTSQAVGSLNTAETIETLEPGMVHYLRAGQKVDFANPPGVKDYDPFTRSQIRRFCASIGITYEDATWDYCMAPETKVLRADLRWVTAESLAVGDEIVAFDEEAPGGRGNRRKFRKAKVEQAGRRDLNRLRIVTNEATVVVSNEHLFLCTSSGDDREPERGDGLQARSENPEQLGSGHRWVRADRLKPGDRIMFLSRPWEDGNTHTHGYLKGMADGEGHVDGTNVGISQNPGIVFNETGEALRSLGFDPSHGNANGNGTGTQEWTICGIAQTLRFLGEVRPSRLLKKAESIYEGRAIGSCRWGHAGSSAVAVQSIEDIGVGPVVTMATSTKTLITEGLLSHNSHVNFSSSRMSRISHFQNVLAWQWQLMIPQMCGPVWGWFNQAALISDLLDLPVGAEWGPPPMPMIEPDREGLAFARLMRAGVMTLPEVMRERGKDYAAHIAELAASNADLDRLGIWLDSDPRRTSAAGLTQERPGGGAKPGGEDATTTAAEGAAGLGGDT